MVTGNLANGFSIYFKKIQSMNGEIGSSLKSAILKAKEHKQRLGFGGLIKIKIFLRNY